VWVYIKGIARVFNWLKCLGEFLHLKPTTVCQISRYYPGLKRLDVKIWQQNAMLSDIPGISVCIGHASRPP
jgi:hypothetical protein